MRNSDFAAITFEECSNVTFLYPVPAGLIPVHIQVVNPFTGAPSIAKMRGQSSRVFGLSFYSEVNSRQDNLPTRQD